MKKALVVGFLFVVTSCGVNAAELDTRPWVVLTTGGTVGQSNTKEKLAADVDNAFSVGMGWDFSQYLATEFNYSYLGQLAYKNSSSDLTVRTLSASLLPSWKFDNMRVFGRVGAGGWDTQRAGVNKRGVSPVVGAGFEYVLGRAITEWSLRVEWQHYFGVGDRAVTGDVDIDTAMVGITFRH